jgi:hypothetical protein
VLSGGRATLRIGAGDYAEEAEGLGLPFPSASRESTAVGRTAMVTFRFTVQLLLDTARDPLSFSMHEQSRWL